MCCLLIYWAICNLFSLINFNKPCMWHSYQRFVYCSWCNHLFPSLIFSFHYFFFFNLEELLFCSRCHLSVCFFAVSLMLQSWEWSFFVKIINITFCANFSFKKRYLAFNLSVVYFGISGSSKLKFFNAIWFPNVIHF